MISSENSTAIDSQADRCERHAGDRWQCTGHCWVEELVGADNRNLDVLECLACTSKCNKFYGNADFMERAYVDMKGCYISNKCEV